MNPEELLILARGLFFAPEPEAYSAEIQWRTAINRAYYAVYIAARALLDLEGIHFSNADASHRQVRDKFLFTSDPLRKQVGKLLLDLFDLRCIADYEADQITVRDADDALHWAGEALKKIQTLRRRIRR